MILKSDQKAEMVINGYPQIVQKKLNFLRKLIVDTAEELELSSLEETTKWGEPSYLTKKGSTVRIDWKSKKPDQYAIYFKCTSKLVGTFRAIYEDQFNYETTRAIVFSFKDVIPEESLKVCIGMALRYHEIKHLPLLGYKA